MSKQALLRFQREGKAVAGLLHPNIVKVHSLQFTEDQQPFLVMEVINGTPLNQIIEFSGPVNVTRALKFLIQICDGIA
ncbi:protein kinase, partial [Escherichia coli]|uniref:protein kinase n=1 Tax=Escherichia coli TaxID=562 RepID=UPI003CF9BC74